MTGLKKFGTKDMSAIVDAVERYSVGYDDLFYRLHSFGLGTSQDAYPPYNLVQLNNHESKLEIALAGFKKDELKVYTEFGKLYVKGRKEESEDDGTFIHKGLAQRSFERVWTVTDDTEIGSVEFTDGLLSVELKKIVPEHHARKDYL